MQQTAEIEEPLGHPHFCGAVAHIQIWSSSVDISYLVYIFFSMCKIFEHKKATKQLNLLPVELLKRYEKWKDIVTISGPGGLKLIKGFNDEPLQGEWKGYR